MSDNGGVLAMVGAAFGIEMLSEGYLSNVGQFVQSKSTGTQAAYVFPSKGFGTRALGFGVVAVALTWAERNADAAPVAQALAGVFLVAVVLMHGEQAFARLGGLFGLDTASWEGATVVQAPTSIQNGKSVKP